MGNKEAKLEIAISFIEWAKQNALNNCENKYEYDNTEAAFGNILEVLRK